MDPNTGRIYQVQDEDDARQRGLIPIPAKDLPAVEKMTPEERVRWAKREGLYVHRLAPTLFESAEEHRKAKNAAKRIRRERREARP